MDVSSEMAHSLLPVFLVYVLGASALSVSVFEGIAEATSFVTKVFSGVTQDVVESLQKEIPCIFPERAKPEEK
jgi:hypothetical protein